MVSKKTESALTLERFLAPIQSEAYAQVILLIADAGSQLSRILAEAPLRGNLGAANTALPSTNATGDQQKKMDLIANDLFVERLGAHHLVRRVISEEMEEPRRFETADDGIHSPGLLVSLDPLDGSSNLDINGVVATIFGIYEDPESLPARSERSIPNGRDLLAAGYILYGPSTQLVISLRQGPKDVQVFTLNPATQSFVLTEPKLQCPEKGAYVCANVAHFAQWSDEVQGYMDQLLTRCRIQLEPVSLRYSGAMASDVHRILLEGGIYLYPPDSQHWSGKIRLLYESIPLAFLFERAGGTSSNGLTSLLEIQPLTPHQQEHTVLGSLENVRDYIQAVSRHSDQQRKTA